MKVVRTDGNLWADVMREGSAGQIVLGLDTVVGTKPDEAGSVLNHSINISIELKYIHYFTLQYFTLKVKVYIHYFTPKVKY